MTTRISYPVNGNIYPIPFTFIDPEYIFVFLDGEPITEFIIDNGNVVLDDGLLLDQASLLVIERMTELTFRLVDFEGASTLTEADLDLSNQQLFDLVQEIQTAVGFTISLTNENTFDAQGNRIVNLATGIDPTDAVNVAQLDEARITFDALACQLDFLTEDNLLPLAATIAADAAQAAAESTEATSERAQAAAAATQAFTSAGEAMSSRLDAATSAAAAEAAVLAAEAVRDQVANVIAQPAIVVDTRTSLTAVSGVNFRVPTVNLSQPFLTLVADPQVPGSFLIQLTEGTYRVQGRGIAFQQGGSYMALRAADGTNNFNGTLGVVSDFADNPEDVTNTNYIDSALVVPAGGQSYRWEHFILTGGANRLGVNPSRPGVPSDVISSIANATLTFTRLP